MQSPRLSLKITDFSGRIRNPDSRGVYSSHMRSPVRRRDVRIRDARARGAQRTSVALAWSAQP